MVVFGVALLAICMLIGTIIGNLLGLSFGLEDIDVGGVGIAMILLVLITDYLKKKKKLNISSQRGIEFWGAMYIPIVVAMAANQDVAGAINGGPMAIIAGIIAVITSFLLVPVISKIGKKDTTIFDDEEQTPF